MHTKNKILTPRELLIFIVAVHTISASIQISSIKVAKKMQW